MKGGYLLWLLLISQSLAEEDNHGAEHLPVELDQNIPAELGQNIPAELGQNIPTEPALDIPGQSNLDIPVPLVPTTPMTSGLAVPDAPEMDIPAASDTTDAEREDRIKLALHALVKVVQDGFAKSVHHDKELNEEVKLMKAELRQIRRDIIGMAGEMKLLKREVIKGRVSFDEEFLRRVKEVIANSTSNALKSIVDSSANRVISSCAAGQTLVHELVENEIPIVSGESPVLEVRFGADDETDEMNTTGSPVAESHVDLEQTTDTTVLETPSVTESLLENLDVETVTSSVIEYLAEIGEIFGNNTLANETEVSSYLTELAMSSSNCAEFQEKIIEEPIKSGVYNISVSGNPMEVYCDLTTDGGGWTVIQRRDDAPEQVDFYLGWVDYKMGFGNLDGEFWLGLDNMHELTYPTPVRLRVDIEDWEGRQEFAEYDTFQVADRKDKYRLFVDGYEQGVGGAGDSMKYHSGMAFTTKDRDNDFRFRENCARISEGAWWYKGCYWSNLNGNNTDRNAKGVVWGTWKKSSYSLRKVEMKIRPTDWLKETIITI